MPKVLVLFLGDRDAVALLDAATAGAESVRFTEVDVRTASTPIGRIKPLETDRAFGDYDGVVLVGDAPTESTGVGARIERALGDGATSNVVFGVVGAGRSEVLERVARAGGIIASLAASGDARADAERLAARVAKVAGWVRHSLGHEAEAHHSHAHDQGGHTHHHHDHHDHAGAHDEHGHDHGPGRHQHRSEGGAVGEVRQALDERR